MVLLFVLGLLVATRPAWSQVDTTDAAPPDTIRQSPPDSAQAADQPLHPFPVSSSLYGRPQTDSIPGRLPHVSVETILADQPGSFLYDLGAIGWPHGWSRFGLAPHRTRLWIDGVSLNNPLTARPQFELLPPSFLEPPHMGLDLGGGPVGVHTSWRDYAPRRPVTELRYRTGNSGLHAIEAAHSQKRRLSLFGRPGLLHLTFGYGGRKTDGVYAGSALQRERRVWGRLRYHTNDWAVELTDRASRYRIGAHGGVEPPGQFLSSIYALPLATTSVHNPRAQRRIIRNDLTARVRAPLLPDPATPTNLAATWTSNTFDARTNAGTSDTTWTTRMNGGQVQLRQSLRIGRHDLTLSARAALWSVAETNVPQLDGSRGEAHILARDSFRVGNTHAALTAGAHRTPNQWFPSLQGTMKHSLGPVELTVSGAATGQRGSWIEHNGFASLVHPLPNAQSGLTGRLLKGSVAARTSLGPVDVKLRGFAHEIRNALDLYAVLPPGDTAPTTTTDTVAARRTVQPVRRAGTTLSLGWRKDAKRGLYASGHATMLQTLNADASPLHTRLARTLPTTYGRLRIGARFVVFTDLITDLYVQGRGWSAMHSRWFHTPTGRLVVPPRENPVPPAPGTNVGPSGTIDAHAEVRLRDATLFFTFENVQASTQLQPGTFVVPVYPLPAQQFRFGVFWPIFD